MIKTKSGLAVFLLILMLTVANVYGMGANEAKTVDIIIGNYWGDYDVNTFRPRNESEENTLQWRRRIASEHGISIRESHIAVWERFLETITTSIMSGRPTAHAILGQPDWAMVLQRRGLLAPLSDSQAVDLTTNVAIPFRQVQWNQDIARTFTFDGKQYAATAGYGESRQSLGLFFNKRVFAEAGLSPDLPYDMQRDGTWTWDGFVNILRRITRDKNNTGQIDTWGMTAGQPEYMLEALVASNGAEFVGRDASGRFVPGYNTPGFLEALNFYRRLINERLILERPEEPGRWDWFMHLFREGTSAMMIFPEYAVTELSRVMTDDFGYVLPPRGPRSNTYRFSTWENVFFVPHSYSGEELDTILKAISLWVTPVGNDWKDGLWTSYRDARAVEETLAMIRGPGHGAFRNYMLVPEFSDRGIGAMVWRYSWWEADPAQLIESVSPNWDALIDRANSN